MEQRKKFIQQSDEYLQKELDLLDAQEHSEMVKRLSEKLHNSRKVSPVYYEAPIVRVIETLEGPSPGEQILLSGAGRRPGGIVPEKMNYVLDYQGHDQTIHAAGFRRTYQELQEEGTVMGTFKKWVRWLISECDNV